MLTDFLRINMPYGLIRNESNEWMAFNREYMPLGFNNERSELKESLGLDSNGNPFKAYTQFPLFTKYRNITNDFLEKVATSVNYNNNGEIVRIFLYNDATNPTSKSKNKKELFASYFEKLEVLSSLLI